MTIARHYIFSGLAEDALRVEAVLVLGLVLGSFVPVSAQTPVPQTIPAQDRTVMSMTIVPTATVPLFAAPFLPSENPGKSAAPFSHVFSRAYERDQGLEGLKRLSAIRQVKTLFLTQSMLPLLQLWGGRLRLDGFTSTLHTQNMQLGPYAAGSVLDFRPQRLTYPGGRFDRFLRRQPELSLWAGRTDRTPRTDMAEPRADSCGYPTVRMVQATRPTGLRQAIQVGDKICANVRMCGGEIGHEEVIVPRIDFNTSTEG